MPGLASAASSRSKQWRLIPPFYNIMMFCFLILVNDRWSMAIAIQRNHKALHQNPSWVDNMRKKVPSVLYRKVFSSALARNHVTSELATRHVTSLEDDNGSCEGTRKISNSSRQNLVSISLAASYFAVMGAKCALPSVLPLLLSPNIGLTFPSWATSPQSVFAQILTLATLSVALGKVLLGPIIDHYGGTASMKVALLVLFVLLGTISLTSSFWIFTTCWIMVDFCFSSCWAACINAIHQYFDASQWGTQVGRLATAARAGNSAAFAAFASILCRFQSSGIKQYWRPVFFAASVVQIVPFVLLSLVAHPSKSATPESLVKRPTFRKSMSTLQREVQKIDFWLHLISRSVLMIFASFLLFVPTLVTSVFGFSAAGGAQVGSLYALGCLVSVTSLSTSFTKSTKKRRMVVLTGLLLGGAFGSSVALLGHVASWWVVSPSLAAVLLFIWGCSFSIPFYIPPSLYALSRGGELCSATITDAFDAIGFCLLAAFNGYVAGLSHTTLTSWIPTFFITTACSFISFVAMIVVTAREKDGDRKQ